MTARGRVDELLAQAGLDLPDDDRELLARRWEVLRPAADSLYEVPEARHEEPSLAFAARVPRAGTGR